MPTWECEECGYIVTTSRRPRRCPDCGAYDAMVLLEEEEDLEDFEDSEDMYEEDEEEDY